MSEQISANQDSGDGSAASAWDAMKDMAFAPIPTSELLAVEALSTEASDINTKLHDYDFILPQEI